MIKIPEQSAKQDKEKYKVPRKVQDVIPIRRMCSDGIFQVGSKFSKSYQFSDINYQVASPGGQRGDVPGLFGTAEQSGLRGHHQDHH